MGLMAFIEFVGFRVSGASEYGLYGLFIGLCEYEL